MSPPSVPDFDPTAFAAVPDPLAGKRALPPSGFVPSNRPTRKELARRRGLALLLGVGWLLGQLAVFGVRGDVSALPVHHLVALVVGPLAGTALCLFAALSSGRAGVGARVAVLAGLALLCPLALFAASLVLSPAVSDGKVGSLADAAYCVNVMLAWAALPLLAAVFALRRSFVARSGSRSALVGLAAGLAAASIANLHCSVSDVLHVTLGHGLAVVLTAVVGAFGLERALRA